MCGIVGIVGPGAYDVETLRRMRDRIRHRGPDSEGEHIGLDVALGVRRLRIIDLETGDQPIASEDGSVVTVFNGEIYGYRELRTGLRTLGHRFGTESDTEVLVHGYETYGDGLLAEIDGMYALAVWDTRRRRLLLARDRLGKKPLLYSRLSDGTLVFGSEFSALLAHPAVSREIDPTAISLYLSLGYIPAPHTAFRAIHKLPPASSLVWQAGNVQSMQYWSPPLPGSLAIGEEDALVELRRLLANAVRSRLVSDVPLGAFLSGGIDSSIIVALMSSETTDVRTFSIGFDESAYSELAHARRVAERYGTKHEELTVHPNAAEIAPMLVHHFGEPFADSSAIPAYYLSRLTRRHVTVALSGDGADDVFGGYDRHQAMLLTQRLPPLARRSAGTLARLVPASAEHRSWPTRARRLLTSVSLPGTDQYFALSALFGPDDLRRIANPAIFGTDPSEEARWLMSRRMDRCGSCDPVLRALFADLLMYLPDDLLVKADISSMACSLEVRAPFLDRQVVEFAVSIPTRLKLRVRHRKYLVQRLSEEFVPRQNRERRKMGFGVPLGAWFRGPLHDLLGDTILSSTALTRGYFREGAIRQLVSDHLEGRRDHGQRLWALLVLELWQRDVVDMTE